jgi:hypothetical protein
MTLKGVAAFTIAIILVLGVRGEARTPCPELIQLRDAATAAWKQAMRAPALERCRILNQAAHAAENTLKYANNNREACDISGIAEPCGRVPPRSGASSRQRLFWTAASAISSRYHPALRSSLARLVHEKFDSEGDSIKNGFSFFATISS